jgi:hypothetical protein
VDLAWTGAVARALLILVLVALPCAAEEDVPRRSFVVPALETMLIQFGMSAFSNLVEEKEFARISFESIGSHFGPKNNWFFDTDTFITNQWAHPYQGSFVYSAARSSGLSFWWSGLYTGISSLLWEYIFEIDAPSINDQITTTIGGTYFGEVIHRAADTLVIEGTEPLWLRYIFAFLVDPMGTFNRWMYSEDLDPFGYAHPRSFLSASVGINLGGRVINTTTQTTVVTNGEQPFLRLLFSYEMPGDTRPFSRFNLDMSASPGALPFLTMFVRGLLWGPSFDRSGGKLGGAYGVWGTYDFSQPAVMRASSVGAGPGAQLNWHFFENGVLQVTGVGSWLPFASVGANGLNEDLYRNYHIGPGVAGVLDVRLIAGRAAMLRVVAQEWFVVGAYVPPIGHESMTYLTVGLWVKLIGRLAASIDFYGAWRAPYFADDQFNQNARSSSVLLSLNYISDDGFGGHLR